MKRKFVGMQLALATAALLGVSELQAQVFTPTYLAPRGGNDVGVYLSDGPGDFAVEGIIRRNFGAHDLGFRAGLVDADEAHLTVGGELRHPLRIDAPINLALTGGAQAILGDDTAFGFQGGLGIGYTFFSPEMTVTPYIHPRIAAINWGGERDEFDLEALAEVGVDVGVSQDLAVRFAASLDDVGSNWGVGIAWR